MIAPFRFQAPVPLVFGEDRTAGLPDSVKRLTGGPCPVVLVADPFLVGNGLVRRAERPLGEAGYDVHLFDAIRSDPLASSVNAIVALARSTNAACVVAMGGGSTMDAAKLAAALAVEGDGAEAYALGARHLPKRILPKIAIPTTSGTGSEVTRTAVFSIEREKLWAWGKELPFDLAILDPTLTVDMPPHLTAATGVDAAVHAIESITNRSRNPVSTAIALGALRALRRWLGVAVRKPGDLDARGHVQIAACLAGIAFDVTGVGAAHAIGHAIGEHAGVHHGRAVGLALNATMPDTATAAPDACAGVAEALGAGVAGLPTADAAALAAPAFDAWLREVGLRIALDDHGLSAGDAREIARLCHEPRNRTILAADSFDYTPERLETAVTRMLAAA